MNDEERQALGEYLAVEIQTNLQKNEAAEQLLNIFGKPILDAKELQYNIMQIVTRQNEGPNGIYLKVNPEDNKNNADYLALLKDLNVHNGKLTRQGYFCWLFDDQKTCGMKLSNR